MVLRDKVEKDLLVSVPVGFVHLDCSSFAMESGAVAVSNIRIDKFLELSMTIAIEKPLIPAADVILYEPLLLSFKL